MAEDRVVLVSGSRKGIGRHLAEHFARDGFTVVGCSRSSSDFQAGNYEHVEADVADESAVKRLFALVRKKYGRLDVLVNNAGVNPALSPALLVSGKAAWTTIGTNLLGTFLMSREAAKIMMRASAGRIVNMGSMAVRHEVPGEAVYTATKAAVLAMTRVMAKELNPVGITVNAVCPGAVKTGIMLNVHPTALSRVLERNAIKEPHPITDVSGIVDWLIRPESAGITGQVIYLGGA